MSSETLIELQVIREEEIMGDPLDISDYFMILKDKWSERGYQCLSVDRYYGDGPGYLALYGTKMTAELIDSDRYEDSYGFSTADWSVIDSEGWIE